MRISAVILALAVACTSASASDDAFKQFTDGRPVTLQPDKAYIFYRAVVQDSIWTVVLGRTFVRLLSSDELKLAQARRDKDGHFTEEPNVVMVTGEDEYTKTGEEWTYLIAVKPGEYLLIGPQVRHTQPGSLCLGTVKFEAKPGVITDLGYIDWHPNKRWPMIPPRGEHKMIGVRPYEDGMPVPTTLANLPRVAGDWRAVAWFPNYFRSLIDRIEPVPGVLDYDDDGRVIDLKVAKPN
jgi:hypothetical protein